MKSPDLRMKARAKVNLSLRIMGIREDGYHETESVMQSVELEDRIRMSPAGDSSVTISWAEGSTGPLPLRPDLAERALDAFVLSTGMAFGARVAIIKRIPLASGLGGGSADAAAILWGANEMAGRPLSGAQLSGLAAGLGSDVPFALTGGTAIATGRGEVVSPFDAPPCWWVLGISTRGLPTADVYSRFDRLRPPASDGSTDLISAIISRDLAAAGMLLANDLEIAAFDLRPELREAKAAMAGARQVLGAVIAGSGPTVAGLCATAAHAESASKEVAGVFDRVECVPAANTGIARL